jgi:hypothetical protein
MLDCEPLRTALLELLGQKLTEQGGVCSGYVGSQEFLQENCKVDFKRLLAS